MTCSLTIAGSDSGGGAGIQADLKTFEAFKVFGLSVISALTAQNTQGVQAVMPIPPEFVLKQLSSVFDDFTIPAVKTGMLANADLIIAISDFLKGRNLQLVVDPVMISTSGHKLLESGAIEVLCNTLLPLASVITPNTDEATELSGIQIQNPEDVMKAGRILQEKYPSACIIIKGGHLPRSENNTRVQDFVFYQNHFRMLESAYRKDIQTHGTGCTFSAAITAGLALGKPLMTAIEDAKTYITHAIHQAPSGIGKGSTPLRHSIQ